MDGLVLILFVLAAFAGGFVSGFSGFAMGLVVSGVWLHIITPVQTAALIAGYGLLTQGYGILKLRQALNWQAIWPLSLGTTIGIPIGVLLLTYINPPYLRLGVGVLLPYVGRSDDATIFCLGYNGAGIAMASLLGQHAAALALGETPELALLAQQGLRPVPFHSLRAPGVRLIAAWYQFLDAVGA